VTAHRAAFAVGNFVYFVLGPEFIILLFWLELSGRHARAVVLWRRFVVAASVTVVVGLVVPAVGAFVFLTCRLRK
jgi:hypothetical protein